jgi:chromatin segregation and condensation protein Rec8/ScpA/Scc1 (kleisin family)
MASKAILPGNETQTQLLDIIVHQDDVSWKQIIFELIETEQMDPWDINLTILTQRFIQMLRQLKETDFRISGKVVLASAVLLKMKADKLQQEEITALDKLIHSAEQGEDYDDFDLYEPMADFAEPKPRPKLIPRTPQPRKRKMSVYDLVEALEKALNVQLKRKPKIKAKVLDKINPPEHHVDISQSSSAGQRSA